MAPLDYFDQKIDGMNFFYTWLDFIGQPQTFLGIIIGNNNNDVDVKLWPGNKMGEFTVAGAYRRMASGCSIMEANLAYG
jgi:hypothetical protein